MIRFDKVTKEFPVGTIALQEVSFHIEPAEFVFVVGPSGAGKTTMLRLLLRELVPTSGEIYIEGQNITTIKKKEIPLLRRKIGAVFQDYKLLEDRTVAENVGLVSEIVKKTKEEIEARVKEVLQLVGLEEKADLFPSQLSGGELQRTAIARALAMNPKILFADEPTGNLDSATAWEILNLLMLINKSGATVVVATHNLDFVKSLKKRMIELMEGRIISDTKKPKQEKKEEEKKEKSEEEKKEKEKGEETKQEEPKPRKDTPKKKEKEKMKKEEPSDTKRKDANGKEENINRIEKNNTETLN